MTDYNKAPSDKIFNEMMECAIAVWNTYDNTYGYVTEKTEQLARLTNYKDNWWTIWGMFDWKNQRKLVEALKRKYPDAYDWAIEHEEIRTPFLPE